MSLRRKRAFATRAEALVWRLFWASIILTAVVLAVNLDGRYVSLGRTWWAAVLPSLGLGIAVVVCNHRGKWLIHRNAGAICPKCRYNLSGHGEVGTCPECGMPFRLAELREYWRRVY